MKMGDFFGLENGKKCVKSYHVYDKRAADLVIKFRDERDWKQFHNPKDCALSLVLESTELLEHFQWKNGDEIENIVDSHRSEIAEELADILYWVLLISRDLDINISEAMKDKLEKNNQKYPIEKAKGKSDKYTKL